MKTIWRLLSFLKPFAREVALSVLIGVATIGAGIGMLGTSAFLIATAALHPSIADLEVAIVGVRFFGISRGVFRYLERLVSHSVNLKVLSRLRVWFYQSAERIAPAGLQGERGGELLNRVMADLETLENFYVRVVSPILVAFIITLGMSLFLGGYFLPLGILLACGMTLNGLILPALSIWMTRRSGEALQKARAALSADMLETFQGLEDLQAANGETRWMEKVQRGSEQVGRLQNYYGLLGGLNNGLSLLAVNLTLLAVMVVAIPQVSTGVLSGVSLAVVSLLTMASFEATNSLPQAAQNLTASIASAKRLFALVEGPSEVQDDEALPDLPGAILPTAKKLEVLNLQFAYDRAGEPVLQNVSLNLERGKLTALVGPSGAGKTSLMNLLLGFWHPSAGEMLLDGRELQGYSAESRRRLFGVISQTNYFFAETLRENLLYAKNDASEAELIAALQTAELGEWYAGLPEGLETWLGEQGARMSGGEAQRLAVARVLLQETPFILLDEPTANLDPDTERKLLATLFRLFREKGVLMITHRLVMLDRADEILFLSGGEIIEAGREKELLAKPGAYRRFWQMQQNRVENDLSIK